MEPSFAVKFSPDDRVLLSGHFDGTIVGYDAHTGASKFEWNITPRETRGKIPVTSLSFRPGGGKPMLLVGCSNGNVDRWDLRSLERTSSVKESGNEVYAAEYRSDGAIFATAGRDAVLRVYDDQTGEVIHKYETVGDTLNPAAARLYSICFPKDDPNLVMTAGWSKTVYVFDMRKEGPLASKPVQELFGPYVAGDAMSASVDSILTASNRLDERIQIWDRASYSATPENIEWPSKNQFLPACAKFSNDAACEFFAVGGGAGSSSSQDASAKEGAFVYDRKNAKLVVDATFDKPINCCAFGNRETGCVAFGDGDGQVHMFETIKEKK